MAPVLPRGLEPIDRTRQDWTARYATVFRSPPCGHRSCGTMTRPLMKSGAGGLDTPVVLLIFNRPDFTEIVFRAIARPNPSGCLCSPTVPARGGGCAVRQTQAVIKVDWPCDLTMEVSDVNLGLSRTLRHRHRHRVRRKLKPPSSSRTTASTRSDILSFLRGDARTYRDDDRVMSITGSNYLGRWTSGWRSPSYHFSHLGSPWAWATWRRAWERFDVTMQAWKHPTTRSPGFRMCYATTRSTSFTRGALMLADGSGHSWDVAWLFTKLLDGGLTIVPAVNLIT